jgi:carbamoyl-phosphate synthase large subunit
MKLLLTAIGKRVQLIKYLKRQFEVVGADCSQSAPAINFVDKFYSVSQYTQNRYTSEILDICEREKVDILISVFEQEF